jgi:hypothetical protein
LVDVGSRLAGTAGLYHYTTSTGQGAEAATQVDIGFHYVGLVSSVPADYDGDGLANYLEDRNGDGSAVGDATSWQSYDSGNGLSGTPGLSVFTPLR